MEKVYNSGPFCCIKGSVLLLMDKHLTRVYNGRASQYRLAKNIISYHDPRRSAGLVLVFSVLFDLAVILLDPAVVLFAVLWVVDDGVTEVILLLLPALHFQCYVK